MVEEKEHENVQTPAGEHLNSDEEKDALLSPMELRRKKRIKYAIYFAIFMVFQIIVITTLSLTILKFNTPKLRLGTTTIDGNLNSTNVRFFAQVKLKNPNFGPYKFDGNTMIFRNVDGVQVGKGLIPKSKTGFYSNKKMNVTVEVDSNIGLLPNNSTRIGDEMMNSDLLTLKSEARLRGKVAIMFMLKKTKYAEMDCTITFNKSANSVRDLMCK